MDKLWAPWRIKYVSKIGKKDKGCVFCNIIKSKKKKDFVFLRSEHGFAVLNLYPYNNGHSLIVPYRHIKDLGKLKPEELLDLFNLVEQTKDLLDKIIKPDGYNVGINIGRAAGAGIPGHLHVHVVPRWSGDVNFMPVVGDTKVISQSMDELYKRLIQAKKGKTK